MISSKSPPLWSKRRWNDDLKMGSKDRGLRIMDMKQAWARVVEVYQFILKKGLAKYISEIQAAITQNHSL